MKEEQIVMIGSGNVGFHLSRAFIHAGHNVVQLYSRTETNARSTASKLGIPFTNDLKKISRKADLYILAVSDHAISEVLKQLEAILPKEKIMIHCSGAIPATVLSGHFRKYGVFYPLQSLNKEKEADFSQIPICIYGSDKVVQDRLLALAETVSQAVYPLDDKQRAVLHVAAVFANNFTNRLLAISHDLLNQHDIDFTLLVPLIRETAEKVENMTPQEAQTGPALRGDRNTVNRHLAFLEEYPEYREIYTLLTKSINTNLSK